MTREKLIEALTTEELQKVYDEKMKKNKVNVQTFSEEDFWKIVDKMNYRKDLSYKRIRTDLSDLKYGDRKTIEEFKNMFNKLYSRLENKMEEHLAEEELDYKNTIGLGDDGLSDLISHIIGIGKKDYYKCLNSIEEMSKHVENGFGSVDGYSESFEYIFN